MNMFKSIVVFESGVSDVLATLTSNGVFYIVEKMESTISDEENELYTIIAFSGNWFKWRSIKKHLAMNDGVIGISK